MKDGENKRFIPLMEYPNWTILFDTQNQAVPYVLVNKQDLAKKTPKTTQDLMDMHVSLFSGDKLIQKFLKSEGD